MYGLFVTITLFILLRGSLCGYLGAYPPGCDAVAAAKVNNIQTTGGFLLRTCLCFSINIYTIRRNL